MQLSVKVIVLLVTDAISQDRLVTPFRCLLPFFFFFLLVSQSKEAITFVLGININIHNITYFEKRNVITCQNFISDTQKNPWKPQVG